MKSDLDCISRNVAGVAFVALFAALTIAFYPCSLLYPQLDFDRKLVRALVSGPTFVVGCAGLYYAYRRRMTELPIWSAFAIGSAILVWFMPPWSHGNAFSLALPALLILLPISLLALSTARVNYPKRLIIPVLVFTGLVLVKLGTAPRDMDLILPFLSFVWLPLAAAALFREKRLSISWVETTACIIYVFSVGYGGLQVFMGTHRSPAGTSGNPNWLSCALVGVIPWVGGRVVKALEKRSVKPLLASVLGWGLVLAPASFILWKCETRTLFLTLAVGAVVWTFVNLKRTWMRVAWSLLCLGVVAFFVQRNASRIQHAVGQDVRIPLWYSCWRLTTDHPTLGVSPRDVQVKLPDVLAESDYHTRHVASDMMQHPHNELLNVALNLGLPAAIAWLALLSPLLMLFWTSNKDSVTKTAWIAATLMLVLGMADKGLAVGPAVAFFPVCLGICWAPSLRIREAKATAMNRIFTVATLGGGGMALLLVSGFASRQLAAQWWNRRGDQLRDQGYYRSAKRLYEKGLDLQPNDYDNAYTIAAISLQKIKPFDPFEAEKDLQRAYSMNPNFSHINRLMGRYWIERRDLPKSRDFFLRDFRLFPENVLSSHWLVYTLLRMESPKHLLDAERELKRRMVGRAKAFTDFSGQETLLVMWLAAMDESRWKDAVATDKPQKKSAVAMTSQLLSALNTHDYVDPVCPWSTGQAWPRSFLGINSSELDVDYWKSVLFRERFYDDRYPDSAIDFTRGGATTGTKSDTVDDGHEDVWQLCKIIYEHVRFDESIAQWTYPHETWENGCGNWDAGYSLLYWLYPGPMLIVAPKDGWKTEALLFSSVDTPSGNNELVVRVNLRDRSIEYMDKVTASTFIEERSAELRLPALPHEYLTRTHALNAVAEKIAGYRKNLHFGGIPTVWYLQTRNRHTALPKFIHPWSVPGKTIIGRSKTMPKTP